MNVMPDVVKLLLHPEKIKIDSLQLQELRNLLKCRSVPYNEDYDTNLLKEIFREFVLPREQRKYRSNHFGRLLTAKQREKYGGDSKIAISTKPLVEDDLNFWQNDLVSSIDDSEVILEPMEITGPVESQKRPHDFLDSESLQNLNCRMENSTSNDLTQSPTSTGNPAKKFKTITYP